VALATWRARPGPSSRALGTRSKAVLIVEDDADVREVLTDAIEDTGRRVFTARDGSDALEKLDSSDIPRPCLILLDWIMSPMSGEEFLIQLRARADADELPVLIMSATPKLLPGAALPGVLGTLAKPFDVEDLNRVLDQHC
jgi:CheY-like chemotaxis protein